MKDLLPYMSTLVTVAGLIWHWATMKARIDRVSEELRDHRAEDRTMHEQLRALVTKTAVLEAVADATGGRSALRLVDPPAPSPR